MNYFIRKVLMSLPTLNIGKGGAMEELFHSSSLLHVIRTFEVVESYVDHFICAST